MTIFYDTEFIENGPEEPIQLISIAMINDQGRELYLQCQNFDHRTASDWVKQNVIARLDHPDCYHEAMCVHDTTPCPWRWRDEIAAEVQAFVLQDWKQGQGVVRLVAHFADYDHVVLSQLFGAMINLPQGFPFWTFDLKQELERFGVSRVPIAQTDEHHALADARWVRHAYNWLYDLHIPVLIEQGRIGLVLQERSR